MIIMPGQVPDVSMTILMPLHSMAMGRWPEDPEAV